MNPPRGLLLDKAIASCSGVTQIAGEPLTVLGEVRQTRSFYRVRDVVDAVVRMADSADAAGEAYNVGGLEQISVYDLARRAVALGGPLPGDEGGDDRLRLMPYDTACGLGFEAMLHRCPISARSRRAPAGRPRPPSTKYSPRLGRGGRRG